MFVSLSFFFFNDTATTEIYTLSLHDALPICEGRADIRAHQADAGRPPHLDHDVLLPADAAAGHPVLRDRRGRKDRKSTRLNSSHSQISYAVFCLKKKKRKSLNHDSSYLIHTK